MTGVIINNNEYQVSTGNTKIEYNAMGGESVGYSMYGDDIPYTEIYEWVPYIIPETTYSMYQATYLNLTDDWGETFRVQWHQSTCLEYLFDKGKSKGSCTLSEVRSGTPNQEYLIFPCDVKITYILAGSYHGGYRYYDKDNNLIKSTTFSDSYPDVICRKVGIVGNVRGSGRSSVSVDISEIYLTAYKQVKKS